MAFDPVPFDIVAGGKGVESFPEITVFNRLLVGRAPVAGLPGLQPLGNAATDVLGVGVKPHGALALQGGERFDDGGEFHAVVRGSRFRHREFPKMRPELQRGRPGARPGVAAAGPIRIDLDALGVEYVLREIEKQEGEDWADICRKKVPFLAEVCEAHPDKKVFWMDVDCHWCDRRHQPMGAGCDRSTLAVFVAGQFAHAVCGLLFGTHRRHHHFGSHFGAHLSATRH